MACKELNPNFTTSEASTKAWMRTRDLIDQYLNITDINGFRQANVKWSEHAQKEYNTEGMLFAEEDGKALPNKEAFRKIDAYKGITYEQRESNQAGIDVAEFEEQRKRISSIMGLDVKYDTSIEQSATVQGNTIIANPDKLFRDTLVHEVGHILIDSIGGLDNPMVRRGIEQLESTALSTEIREIYKDQPEDIIQKEILATAIGREGADIFGERQDRVNKWQRWLDLFFRRIKQVLGIDQNVAKQMASEIIFHQPTLEGAQQRYERRDATINKLESEISKIQANLKSEVHHLREQEVENYQERANELEDVIKRLENANIEISVASYVDISSQRVDNLLDRINQDDLSFNDLRAIKEDLSPFEDITELVDRLEYIDFDNVSESDIKFKNINKEDLKSIQDTAAKTIATISLIKNRYFRKAKELIADKFSTAENGVVHQRYREKFEDEFDAENTESALFGMREKRYVEGERVSSGEYGAAKSKYVQQKMDAYRDQIVEEEYEHVLDSLDATPSDIGFIEHFAYDSEAINDEIIQIATELMAKAENITRSNYFEMEREIKDVHDKFIQNNPNPTNQQKKWDFILADELDENGNPTGEKIPYLKGDFNPSFVVHKRELRSRIEDANTDVVEAHSNYLRDNERYAEEYEQAKRERDRAEKEYSDWIERNTVKSGGREVPINKWRMDQDLTQSQKEMRDYILSLRDKIEELYPANGQLTDTDSHIGEYTRIPAVNKTSVEAMTDGNIFQNAIEKFKDLYTPKEEDLEYGSVSQEVYKYARDNKLHYSLPIYYRGEASDQSYDVLSAMMMDYYQALNYNNKRNIEAEIIALKDISRERVVGAHKSSIGKGIQSIKNFFGQSDDLILEKDQDEDTANRYKTLKALIDARMYGVRRKGNETINKIADSIISFTSLSIMPGNIFSMFSNLIAGKSTTFIELIGDSIPIERRDWISAEKEYMINLPRTLGGSLKAKKEDFVTKLLETYDSMGDFYGPTFRFAEDSWAKQLFQRGTLYSLTTGVEHYISGVLTMSALKSMKLQNENGDYINREGNTVKDRNKAATMYDLHAVEGGEIIFEDIQGAYKTDNFDEPLGTDRHHELTKNYIRNLIAQTQGQYDSKSFAVGESNVLFRAFQSLRQWMFRGLDRHWRGFSHVFADEIPESAKFRSRFGGTDSVGYSTQMFNTAYKSGKGLKDYIASMVKDGKKLEFDIVKQPWQDLSARERSRIRKAVATYVMAGSAMVLTKTLMNLEADDEDIPDEIIYLAFTLERTKQELMFYNNPFETMRILRSPAASVSMLRKGIKLFEQAGSDIYNAEFERYERGRFAGKTKLEKQLTDITPVFSQLNRDARTTLSFIQSMSAAD